MDSICVEEDKRREEFGHKPLSYKSLLSERERQVKNTNGENFESDIIWYILEENHEDNEIKLEIKKHISEIDEKVWYSQIYEHDNFHALSEIQCP